jgi:hypothetical protein
MSCNALPLGFLPELRRKGRGQPGHIRTFRKPAEKIVAQDFMNSADARGDNGQSASKGLEDNVGQPFVTAGDTEQIGSAHQLSDFRRRLSAGKKDLALTSFFEDIEKAFRFIAWKYDLS